MDVTFRLFPPPIVFRWSSYCTVYWNVPWRPANPFMGLRWSPDI